MKKLNALVNTPTDTYSRAFDEMLGNALPKINDALCKADELILTAVYRQGDQTKIIQLNLDHGVTAPPPETPSRIREITITPEDALPGDVYISLAETLEVDVLKYGKEENQTELHIGKFDSKRIFKSGQNVKEVSKKYNDVVDTPVHIVYRLYNHPNIQKGFPSKWKNEVYGTIGAMCSIVNLDGLERDKAACINACAEPMMAVDDSSVRHLEVNENEHLLFYKDLLIGYVISPSTKSISVYLSNAKLWQELLRNSGFSPTDIEVCAIYSVEFNIKPELLKYAYENPRTDKFFL